tara:strand:+ start:1532 stop:1729 length:198 start_codon:yes stop_codon:yes gene_type:complete
MLTEFLVKQLKLHYDETISWTSKNNIDEDTYIDLFENTYTGTWTLIERKEKVACVLASGKKGLSI